MTAHRPTSADVGTWYDQNTDLYTEEFGGNIHFGYWHDEKDDSPVEAAIGRLTNLVADRLALTDGQCVLDVGCGTGEPAIRIATNRNVHVTGITISDYQVQLATTRRPTGELPGQATFHLADAMELPFEDASFDGAYAIESIIHMPDKGAVFSHLARVLRPGARLAVADFYQDGDIDDGAADLIADLSQSLPLSFITADAYRRHLNRAGLRLVEFTDISDRVRRSYDILAAVWRKGTLVSGGAASAQLTAGAALIERVGRLPQIRYMLLTAVRT